MNKKTIRVFNRTNYLLGKDNEGTNYYLEQPKFDCGWYWGGLYIETFTNNNNPTHSKDIASHGHFNTMFLKDYNSLFNFFKESVLSGHEKCTLLELARTFYTLKEVAGLYYRGTSAISNNPCKDTLKAKERYLEVVKVLLPNVISQICNLLGGNTTPEQFANQVKKGED